MLYYNLEEAIKEINKGNGELKLEIDNALYFFEPTISMQDHAFNNAGVSLKMKKVYPESYADDDVFNKPFKLKRYSSVAIYWLDSSNNKKHIFYGFLKKQSNSSLSPNKPKWIDIECVTWREFLTTQPMDFPCYALKPEVIFENILNKIRRPNFIINKFWDFDKGDVIDAYNTQNKTAFQVLQMLQSATNSIMFINYGREANNLTTQTPFIRNIFMVGISNLSDPTYDVKNAVGSEYEGDFTIDYTTLQAQKDFWQKYEIEEFSKSSNNSLPSNFVRVESEKVVSATERVAKFDLSIVNGTVSLPEQIATINRATTQVIDSNGKPWRKLMISEQSQNKISDIVYKSGENSISVNDRLKNKGTLIVRYKSVYRNFVDAQSIADQINIAASTHTNGIIYRYEKHNDLTSLKELARHADFYLANGSSSDEMITIISKQVLFKSFQRVIINGDSWMKQEGMDGVFFVRDISTTIKDGILTMNYQLVRPINLQNGLNVFDSLSHRDNPLLAVDNASVETSLSLSDDLNLVYNNLVLECEDVPDDMGLEEELETTLDGNDNTTQLYKYKLYTLGEI